MCDSLCIIDHRKQMHGRVKRQRVKLETRSNGLAPQFLFLTNPMTPWELNRFMQEGHRQGLLRIERARAPKPPPWSTGILVFRDKHRIEAAQCRDRQKIA